MVIPEERSRLQKALGDLVTGRMTTWQFDEVYDELERSHDRAVAEIARFGWGLYSDGVPYRLTVHYKIDKRMLDVAERCLLFLRSSLEYSWPESPSLFWRTSAGGLAYNSFPVGIALTIVSLLLLAIALGDRKDFVYSWALGIPGVLILFLCGWLWRWSNKRDSPAWQKYWESGDKDAWPFLNQRELKTHSRDLETHRVP